MKKLLFITGLLIPAFVYSQWPPGTSFEEPDVFAVPYTDTGDPAVPHDLINNSGEPFVNFPQTNDEYVGYNARYEPYDVPDEGLTDGDDVGVTDNLAIVGEYTDGNQGYQISDVDGNFILEFDPIFSAASSIDVFLDYYISETGYEGDGTVNSSGSDRLRIYLKDHTNNAEYDMLDTTGSDINDLNITGSWINGHVGIANPFGDSIQFQLIIEARTNSAAEAFFFDNMYFIDVLGIDDQQRRSFSIYPNPASKGITISTPNAGMAEVQVYNLLGSKILDSEVNGSLDISSLKSGIYLLRISQQDVTEIKKLIVE